MKKSIFENAKFGDKFLTRDGKRVMFIFYLDDIDAYHCVCEDWYELLDYAPNGKAYAEENHPTDIVSRYQESIDKDKLDELATIECSNRFIGSDNMAVIICNIANDLEQSSIDAYMIGFKEGYRKAIEG